MFARGTCDAADTVMLLTTESTAWTVTFSAGVTAGGILGYGITPWSVAKVLAIAFVATLACARLLRTLASERLL